jgi:hypothetical protein
MAEWEVAIVSDGLAVALRGSGVVEWHARRAMGRSSWFSADRSGGLISI